MFLSIREAARQAGTSKSAVFRAIHAGRLSATRDDHGNFQVDPAELHRWAASAERGAPRNTPRDATGNGAGGRSDAPPDTVEIRIENAALQAEVKALREMAQELRADRDRWHGEAASWKGQAERLLLAAPLVTPAPPSATASPAPRTTSWWRWWERQAS